MLFRRHTEPSQSILAEFLDVITCGFASVLVLGLIFSIILPSTPATKPQALRYELFEFAVKPSSTAPEGRLRYALRPVLSYEDEKGSHTLKVDYDETGERYYPTEKPPFEVTIIGFSRDPTFGATAVGDPDGSLAPRQVWSVLFSGIPEKTICDVQVGFVDQSGGGKILPITVLRMKTPGPRQEQTTELKIGAVTAFSQLH